MSIESLDLPDEQIDSICNGLKQNAAKVRFLQRMGLKVLRRPNGRPLVARLDWERLHGKQQNQALPSAQSHSAPRWKNKGER